MKYIQLIEQARSHGMATEKKMREALELLSCDLKKMAADSPALYQGLLRNQHAVFYDRHYSEAMANHDVNQLVYSDYDDEGCPIGKGNHWSCVRIAELTKDLKFHPKVNDWDKYVAFNAMYADLCANMSEEEIIKAAYAFFFCDTDWQPMEDDCTKIWDYVSLHAMM